MAEGLPNMKSYFDLHHYKISKEINRYISNVLQENMTRT